MLEKVELKALFFDMDGVLVDVSRSYRRAIEETVEQFTGRRILPGTIQRYKNVGGFNDDWLLTHAIVTDTSMTVPFSRVVKEFQRRYRGENWDGFISEEPPIIQTRTLDALCTPDRILGVVTGRPEAEARWTIERFGWQKYFPLIVAKEKQEGRMKPDPFPLQHALTILAAAGRRIQPEMTAYVGDTVDDMTCAREAGMWAIGFIPPYVENAAELEGLLRERGAHVIIDDIGDLPDLIQNFGERLALNTMEGEV